MPNPARSRGRQVNAFQALALLLSFVLVAGIGGVLAAGLALPGVALANGATDVTAKAFDDLPTELAQPGLPQKSTILAANGTLLATFYSQNRDVVPLTEISPMLQHAVIATEDKRFYEHAGVDPAGMLRAFVRNQASSGGQQGASTLTQQYVKNVLIEAALAKDTEAEKQAALEAARGAEGSEGIARKLREAKLAISLEKKMTKDQILEKYLNIAQFGKQQIYGAESAAQYYFSKHAKDLTYLEAATIAGVTQSPSKWDPVAHPEAAQTRRNTVLRLMHEQGYITDADYTAGVATPLPDTLHVQAIKPGCALASTVVAGAGYFCDYVTKVIVNDEAFGATKEERRANLYRGGLTITTTLNPGAQTIADREVKAGIPVMDPSGVSELDHHRAARHRADRRDGPEPRVRGGRRPGHPDGVGELQHRLRLRRLERLRARLDVQAVHPSRVAQDRAQPVRPRRRDRAHAEREPVHDLRGQGPEPAVPGAQLRRRPGQHVGPRRHQELGQPRLPDDGHAARPVQHHAGRDGPRDAPGQTP